MTKEIVNTEKTVIQVPDMWIIVHSSPKHELNMEQCSKKPGILRSTKETKDDKNTKPQYAIE